MSAEKKFIKKLKEFPKGVTPGFVMQVYKKGRKVLDIEHGKTWKYYDLASLTKIIFTVPQIMKAVEDGHISVATPTSQILPWYSHPSEVRDLLRHWAGNVWWRPFFKELTLKMSVEDRKNQLRDFLRHEQPQKNPPQSVYSDIDFFLLGFIAETIFEKNWTALWEEFRGEVLDGEEIFFVENNKSPYSKKLFAPTQKCTWRRRQIQGEVDDNNTWALGGVAPHAGLFGTVDAVSEWGLWLRDLYYVKKEIWLKAATLAQFSRRALPAAKGDWALGFMMPTEGSASCGSYFSPQSFGHTGFTGTSFWFDPVEDFMVVLLSNRVHPTRKNEEFRKWRPVLHNWAVEACK